MQITVSLTSSKNLVNSIHGNIFPNLGQRLDTISFHQYKIDRAILYSILYSAYYIVLCVKITEEVFIVYCSSTIWRIRWFLPRIGWFHHSVGWFHPRLGWFHPRIGWFHPIFQIVLWNKIASAARNWINSVPHAAAMTFAFSSCKSFFYGNLYLNYRKW